MVITKLYGGLGNQMFQYVVGLALADKLSTSLYFDLTWFEEIKTISDATQREYELDILGIKPRRISFKDRVSLKRQPLRPFKEEGLGYQETIWELRGNILLDGYWQSYKYLEGGRDKILKSFQFPLVSQSNLDNFQKIKNTESVAVHVRRGDYANVLKTKKYHGLISVEYYSEAAKKIAPKHKGVTFFVFSDDLAWCEKNLKLPCDTVFVSSEKSKKGAAEDMYLMSSCKHNIIANSSFSWWAAWLNKNPQKVVVAPKKWFLQADAKLEDRLPPDWVQL